MFYHLYWLLYRYIYIYYINVYCSYMNVHRICSDVSTYNSMFIRCPPLFLWEFHFFLVSWRFTDILYCNKYNKSLSSGFLTLIVLSNKDGISSGDGWGRPPRILRRRPRRKAQRLKRWFAKHVRSERWTLDVVTVISRWKLGSMV